MNIVTLVGRLTKNPEIQDLESEIKVARFSVAVQRKFKENGEYKSDFINCVAWRNTAEFVGKYFKKGNKIGVIGNLQTRNYEANDGTKKYVTEVVVDNVEFVDNKEGGDKAKEEELEPVDMDSLPF